MCTERIADKAFRTTIFVHPRFKRRSLSASIKLTLHKALIRPIITYVCSTWEFAADTCLLRLQRLQNKVLRTTGKFPRRTPTCKLHVAFNIPYIHDLIT